MALSHFYLSKKTHGGLVHSYEVSEAFAFIQLEKNMPYINIKITREGATPAQKAALIAGVTRLLVDVLGKTAHTSVVMIDEIEADN